MKVFEVLVKFDDLCAVSGEGEWKASECEFDASDLEMDVVESSFTCFEDFTGKPYDTFMFVADGFHLSRSVARTTPVAG